ncbi:hypothetical protein [Streptomyces sp. NRRL S-1813]|uniref:hypothetical protein n=1 Tax=Streptomyces sp. NRRL S-1813 TaxID=1463888 RepID=UPI0004C74142|nr:hypothetical protein [Streptomyces sp. NRRL S-1813]
MSAYEPLSPEHRAALAELIGDAARPATADFLLRLGHTVKDCRTHDHGTGEGIFCGNLVGWMGERMALVVRRLLDAEAELEKYVGKEPTRDEEAQHVNRCLDAVYHLCEEVKRAAGRWENPLPVPEWVAAVEQAADGNRPDNPDDKRRRIYLDGKGNAWISHCTDPADGELIARLDSNPFHDGEPVQEVREHTGGLREIGRCW